MWKETKVESFKVTNKGRKGQIQKGRNKRRQKIRKGEIQKQNQKGKSQKQNQKGKSQNGRNLETNRIVESQKGRKLERNKVRKVLWYCLHFDAYNSVFAATQHS